MGDRIAGFRRVGTVMLPGDAVPQKPLSAHSVKPGQVGPKRITSRPAPGAGPAPRVEIVIPVRNEECALAPSVRRLAAFLRTGFPFHARIAIADNGSSDGTWAVATELCAELADVRAVRLEQPGRGRALKSCWLESDAEVLAYMDVDLSSGLNALLPLVSPLLSGHSDIAIGSRLARGARVSRGSRREIVSRCYNLLLHTTLNVGFSDAQCGFKAIRADKARSLLPLTEDTAWFFDTELLVLAERAGLRVHEVPVDWTDDPDSSVDIFATAIADLRGVARLGWHLARGTLPVPVAGEPPTVPRAARGLPGQLLRFCGIGVASAVAYVILYFVLRGTLSAQEANAASLLITAVANTAANRRVTFGIRGRAHAARHQVQGLLAFGSGLALTSMALAALTAVVPRPTHAIEVTVLVAASLLATVVRFVLYRSWVFRPRQAPPGPVLVAGRRPDNALPAESRTPGETRTAAMGGGSVAAAQPDLSATYAHGWPASCGAYNCSRWRGRGAEPIHSATRRRPLAASPRGRRIDLRPARHPTTGGPKPVMMNCEL
jgi:putative flippase GtrA